MNYFLKTLTTLPCCLTLLILLGYQTVITAQEQPTLGLALSGGGAKGLAHIGVLQELEKNGIFPQFVSGTSMGSIVGGLYSIGYDPDQLKKVALDIKWNDYFSDSYLSRYIPIEERRRSAQYQLSFPLINGKLSLPKGLLIGRKIQTLLGLLTIPSQSIDNFDDFHFPFRAVATDIETGKAYVFKSGLLHHAIRASMAIPSVFSPVSSLDGHLLVDGLVVRNLPVQEVYDLGAEYSIAVDVGTPLYTRDELTSLITIVEQTASFGSASFNAKQRAMADIIIDPDLGKYTTLSYDAVDSIIALGAATARLEMPRILRQLDSLGFTLPMQQTIREQLITDSFHVTSIAYACEDPVIERILEKLSHNIEAPRYLTRTDIQEHISYLYGSGFFNIVDFRFTPYPGGQQLILSAEAAPDWRARFSASYDSNYELGFLINLTGRNIIGSGSVLGLDARISEFPRATMEYLLYNHTSPSIGLRVLTSANYYPTRVYENFELDSEFRSRHLTARLSAFSGFGGNRYLEAGILSENIFRNPRFTTGEATEAELNRQALFFELIRETYDRSIYPLKGSRSHVFLQANLSGIERTEEERLSMGSNVILTGRHHRIVPMSEHFALSIEAAGGFVNRRRDNPLNQLYLGRVLPEEPFFFNAYGQRHMELPVSGFATGTVGARLEVGNDKFISLFYQYGLFATSSGPLINTKGVFLDPNRINGQFQGIALEIGSRTLFGPVNFNAEYNPELGRMNYNLHLGYWF